MLRNGELGTPKSHHRRLNTREIRPFCTRSKLCLSTSRRSRGNRETSRPPFCSPSELMAKRVKKVWLRRRRQQLLQIKTSSRTPTPRRSQTSLTSRQRWLSLALLQRMLELKALCNRMMPQLALSESRWIQFINLMKMLALREGQRKRGHHRLRMRL